MKKPKKAPKPYARTRKNGADADELKASKLTEQFHGRPAKKVTDVEEIEQEHSVLADLGRLLELEVWFDADKAATLAFTGNVRMACSPDGGTLYFVGGDQKLALKELGLAEWLPKDRVTVGEVERIVYRTSKAFHNFEPTDYEHTFAEEGGELPILGYDTLNGKLYLTGGSYQVRPEGIRN